MRLSELALERFYPADDATRTALVRRAGCGLVGAAYARASFQRDHAEGRMVAGRRRDMARTKVAIVPTMWFGDQPLTNSLSLEPRVYRTCRLLAISRSITDSPLSAKLSRR